MEVQIANTLDITLHVAVVKHSALNVEFVISPQRVPIPSGEVVGHWDLEPGTALSVKNLNVDTQLSMALYGYQGAMGVTVVNTMTDDGPLSHVTLGPPRDPDGTPGDGEKPVGNDKLN